MTFRIWGAGAVVALGVWGCASGADGGDCAGVSCGDDALPGGTGANGPGAGAGAGAGGSGTHGAGPSGAGGGASGGGAGGPCNLLCGTAAAPWSSAGLASYTPPGCDGGEFVRTFAMELPSDGAKSVPALADLNADGRLDLALNARATPTAMVLAGLGQGAFAKPTWLPSGGLFAGGWGLDLGDVDGDGLFDLVAGDHASGALAWRNQGSLSFALANTGLPGKTLFSGAGVADVDGDGDLDALFGADQFGMGLRLFLSDGGTGWTEQAAPELAGSSVRNAGYVAFADFDEDADPDAFVFGQTTGALGVFVFRNDGAGKAWSPVAQLSGGSGQSIGNPVQGAVGDVDCDGALDVVAGGTVHHGAGGGWQLGPAPDASKIGHLGDMNGDGFADLVTHSEALGLRLYLNDGTGKSWSGADVGLPDETYQVPEAGGAAFSSAYGIDLADVDGDGALDVARTLCVTESGLVAKKRCFVEVWVRQ